MVTEKIKKQKKKHVQSHLLTLIFIIFRANDPLADYSSKANQSNPMFLSHDPFKTM